MRRMVLPAAALVLVGAAAADDAGPVVEFAGMKSAAPAGWKERELKPGSMRKAEFTVPAAEGDKDPAEVAVFVTRAGGGVEANVQRQVTAFAPAEGKDKVDVQRDKIQVGTKDATYVTVTGTFKKRPFPMAEKFTPVPGYKSLYVLFDEGGTVYSVWLRGPEKTVDKNKPAFDEWLKNFK